MQTKAAKYVLFHRNMEYEVLCWAGTYCSAAIERSEIYSICQEVHLCVFNMRIHWHHTLALTLLRQFYLRERCLGFAEIYLSECLYARAWCVCEQRTHFHCTGFIACVKFIKHVLCTGGLHSFLNTNISSIE